MTAAALTVVERLVDAGRRAIDDSTSPLRAMATTHFVDGVSRIIDARDHPTISRIGAMLATLDERSGHVGVVAIPDAATNLSRSVWVDAIACHVDEADAFHRRAAIAPGGAVIPAAFAVAGVCGLSGRRLTDAILAGFEVSVEAALMLGGNGLYARSWWPTALVGALGSAAACSVLLELDERESLYALSIAANGLGGLLAGSDLAEGHYLLLGQVAQRGVDAAYGASVGLTGSAGVLDSPAEAAIQCPTVLERHSRLHIEDCEFKAYPCANPLQPVVDAVLAARHNGCALADVDAIRVELPAPSLAFVSTGCDVASPAEAARNIRFVVSAALTGHESDLRLYRHPELPEAARRMTVELAVLDSASAETPLGDGCRVSISLRSGDVVTADGSGTSDGGPAVGAWGRCHPAVTSAFVVSRSSPGRRVSSLDDLEDVSLLRDSLLQALATSSGGTT